VGRLWPPTRNEELTMVEEGTFFEDDESPEELEAALERSEPVMVNPPVTEWQWRVGTSYDVHVYALHPTAERDEKGRSDLDIPVLSALGCPGMAREVAAHIVYAHNRLLRSFDDSRYDALADVTPEELSLASQQEIEEGMHGDLRQEP
jgi:hypothetical protein